MPKKSRVRTLMDNKQLKGPKYCPNLDNCSFVIFGNNFSSKNSVLLVSEILNLFDNMWTPDDKDSLSVKVSV